MQGTTGSKCKIKRILMTADTVGGVWTYTVELAKALREYNLEIILATMGKSLRKDQRKAVAAIPNIVHLAESKYKLEWMNDPWPDVDAAGEWLLHLENIYNPDLVHLNGYSHAVLPWQAPVLVVAHSCVFSWFAAVKGHNPSSDWREYYNRVSRGLRAAVAVTAPSSTMLNILRLIYGPCSTVHPIYNGRHPKLFRPRKKENYVLTAGRIWDEAKNIALLEKASSALQWPLFIAGENIPPESTMNSKNMNGQLGHLDEQKLARVMGHATIFALPARYEPFGLTALEAGLCECALVLGDIPSLREIWGDAALFVAPDDENEIVATANALCRDKTLCLEMARRARTRALQFTPTRMGSQYMRLYGHVSAASIHTEHERKMTNKSS